MDLKLQDSKQIEIFIDKLFSEHHEGMYFDEFVNLAKEVTSELFLGIYDCVYQNIPCAKNFLVMRQNYISFLKSSRASNRDINF